MKHSRDIKRFTEVSIDAKKKTLTVVVPIDEALPLSSTGKTHLVYTSRVPLPTDLFIEGREVYVSMTAFIERIPGRE